MALEILRAVGVEVREDGKGGLTLDGPPSLLRQILSPVKKWKPVLLAAVRGVPVSLVNEVIPPPGWTAKPDVDGRAGWERASLHGWESWWRRARFEGLPEPPDNFRCG